MNHKNVTIQLFNDLNRCWEAYPNSKHHEIALNTKDVSNQDQKWTIIDHRITVNTRNSGAKVAECYPKSNRLETSKNDGGNQDQVFQFEPVPEESNVFYISCNTKNQGKLYVYGNSENKEGIGLRSFNESDTELYWKIN
jgi:hypothetical protein